MKRIAVDMDEVLADSLSRELDLYERDFGSRPSLEQLSGKSLHAFAPEEQKEQIKSNIYSKGFFKDLPLIDNAVDVMKALNDQYEVFITTAAMPFPYSFNEKYEWLQKHFDFIPFRQWVFCGHKHFISADYMIDDWAFNFENFKGEGLLFGATHNEGETDYKRFEGWLKIGEYLL